MKTAERLALEYKVGVATIHRDAQLARAVNKVDENCPGARDTLLSRDYGVRRAFIIQLARRTAEEQREVIAALRRDGKLPRRPRSAKPAKMTLPREPQAFAAGLLETCGLDECRLLCAAVTEMISNQPRG